MNLGKKIAKIRKDNKMSQDDFAEQFDVTRQTISSWENSKSYPDIETLIRISNKFDISLDILLKEDKNMVEQIDKKVREGKKLKIVVSALVILILIIIACIFTGNYLKNEKIKKDDERYQKIINNIKVLGFGKSDGIGFSSIEENGVTYTVYTKKLQVLDPNIMAKVNLLEDDSSIFFDYNGESVAVTYANQNVITLYCTKNGNLQNDKQNANNNEIYNKYKDKTTKIITRMVELYNEIYK